MNPTKTKQRLGQLRNHPLVLTPLERFLPPAITLILLTFGRTVSTWKTSSNQQFDSHKVDIWRKVQGDKDYWRIFTHRKESRYPKTLASEAVFRKNAKSHLLNDDHQSVCPLRC